MKTYFYFQSPYRNCSDVAYFVGSVIRETEKAVLIKLERNGVNNHKVKDELWMPKAAIKRDNTQPDNYQIAKWFKFQEGSYASKVYENSVMFIRI